METGNETIIRSENGKWTDKDGVKIAISRAIREKNITHDPHPLFIVGKKEQRSVGGPRKRRVSGMVLNASCVPGNLNYGCDSGACLLETPIKKLLLSVDG